MSSAALRYVAEDGTTGYADAADRLVRAVRATGTGVELRALHAPPDGAPRLVASARDDSPGQRARRGRPTVAHLIPERCAAVRAAVGTGGPLLAHTVWETDRLPGHWPALLDAVDGVIVPSGWNRDVFAASGVSVPIEVVPHVACAPSPGDAGEALALDDDLVVFYVIGRWDRRKAIDAAVEAFLRAFRADDPVVLVVKTTPRVEMPPVAAWGTSDPMAWTTGWQVAHLLSRHRDPPRVQLAVGPWSEAQIAGLHHRGDCYLTLARGEGWGMGAFDAAAHGNPVIATGWGGFLEYLDDDGATLVGHRVVAVESDASSYAPDQRWAEPDLDHAVELLRAVAADPAAARRRVAARRERVLRTYAPEVVAHGFLDALRRLT